MELAVI